MRNQYIAALALLASGLCWSSLSAGAQPGSQQQPSDQTPLPSAPAPAKPAAANPAPASKDKEKEDKDKSAAAPPSQQSPAPDAPPASAKKPSTADDNPFPEAVSEAAAKSSAAASAPAAPTPTGTPARQEQGSSSLDNTDKLGLDDPARKQLKLQSPDGSDAVYDPKRAAEDLRVGKFYLQRRDFKGAYDRFKDATLFDHENAEAVFWLAEAARKLNLEKEAEQNYELYLAAVPDGPSAKAAKRALGELASNSKP